MKITIRNLILLAERNVCDLDTEVIVACSNPTGIGEPAYELKTYVMHITECNKLEICV